MKNGSWLSETNDQTLVFCSPFWYCAVAYLLAFLFATIPQVMVLGACRDVAANPSSALLDYGSAVFWELIVDILVLFLLWLGGATRLEIDLRKRSYLYTRRWLFDTQTRFGTLDDMAGVCLMGEDLSQVFLLLKNPVSLSKGYRLGMYSSQKQAEAEAQEFAQILEMPVVKGPRT